VSLIEAKDRLGGRAHSFRESTWGQVIDNCQHVLLGCCESTAGFLAKVGSMRLVEFDGPISFVGEKGRNLEISSSRLPSPLHLLPSVARTRYFSASEKLSLSRVMAHVAMNSAGDSESAGDYLQSLACPQRLSERLFEPILSSALNETARTASAKYARMVLIKSLLGQKEGWRLGVPRPPLCDVLALPAWRYLARRGCEVRTQTKVERLNMHEDRVESVSVDGHTLHAAAYVCAVTPDALAQLGFDTPAARHLKWNPIVSAHLFFDGLKPVFDRACVVGGPFQWVFNKSGDSPSEPTYLQTVASAAESIVNEPKDSLVSLALDAVAKAAPQLAGSQPAKALVIRERHATFSTGGECDAHRPPTVTNIPNLFLAGDWTQTQWPSTIESAVRSGRAAADAVLQRL
jgi:squalene-associated FAD-dependent desaturase